MNLIESLKRYTTVVADTGDLEAIAEHKPQDATTNPSLLFQAAQKPAVRAPPGRRPPGRPAMPRRPGGARRGVHGQAAGQLRLRDPEDRPRPGIHRGRCRAELRHRGNAGQGQTARSACTQKAGIGRERVLIKIASTWEGIRAAEQLEREGIHCNLTLLFSFAQAVACAEAGVTLISPFVGRIYDWYRKERGSDIPAGRGSRRGLGHTHLQLLQEVRLQDAGHGGQLPQGGPDRPARRLRSADHQPRPAGTDGEDARRGPPPSERRNGQGVGRHEDPPGREDLPLDAQRGRDGGREAERGHSQVLRRRPQARTVRPGQGGPADGQSE